MITLLVMVGATVWNRGKLHALPMLLGLFVGYVLAISLKVLPWTKFLAELDEPWISLPHRAASTLSFRFALLAPFLIACLTSNLKIVGDITLCQKINDLDWKRTDMRSVSGGLLSSGLGTFFAGLLGGTAQNSVSSSVGLSLASGTTSRSLAYTTGLLAIALAFFPKLSAVLAGMPGPVVGAILIYSACFIVLGGMQLLTSRMLDARRVLSVGIALIFGLSVEISPELYRNLPEVVLPFFSSSTALATVLVVSLSLLFRLGIAKRVTFAVIPGPGAFDKISYEMETQGSAWGMRRDVAMRGEHAIAEAVNSAHFSNPGLQRVDVSIEFDELKLDADLDYEGAPIQLSETAPRPEELATDTGIAALSAFMINQFADQVRIKSRKGLTRIEIHLAH